MYWLWLPRSHVCVPCWITSCWCGFSPCNIHASSNSCDLVAVLVFLPWHWLVLHERHAIPYDGLMRGLKLVCLAIVWIASVGGSKGQIFWLLSKVKACEQCMRIANRRRLDELWRLLYYWCWCIYCCITSMITSMPPHLLHCILLFSPWPMVCMFMAKALVAFCCYCIHIRGATSHTSL